MQKWELVEIKNKWCSDDELLLSSTSQEDLNLIEDYIFETYPKMQEPYSIKKTKYSIVFNFNGVWHSRSLNDEKKPFYMDVIVEIITFIRKLSYYPFSSNSPSTGATTPLYYCFIKRPLED